MSQESLKEDRGLTQRALQRLLEWLDQGMESEGSAYLEMRRRLVAYFDRHQRRRADDLADETLNRVARALEAGEIRITPPARYCYVIARYVWLEDIRRERLEGHLDAPDAGMLAPATNRLFQREDTQAVREQRLECLDGCLAELRPDQRDLLLDYYRDETRDKIERRREIARRLGISMNALAIRACRIRGTLESCVGACCQGRQKP